MMKLKLSKTVKSVTMYDFANFELNDGIEELTILNHNFPVVLPKFLKHLCLDTDNDIITELTTLNLESCYILNNKIHKFVNPEKHINLKKVVAKPECFLCEDSIMLPPNLERLEFTSEINNNFSNIDYLHNLKELRLISITDLLLFKKLPNNLEILHVNIIDPYTFGDQTTCLPVPTSFYKFTGNIMLNNAVYSFCKKYNIQNEIIIDFYKLAKENTLLVTIPNTTATNKIDLNDIPSTVTHLNIHNPNIYLQPISKNIKYLKFGVGFVQPIQNLLHSDLSLLILPNLYPHANFYLGRTEIVYDDDPDYFRKPNCIKSFYE